MGQLIPTTGFCLPATHEAMEVFGKNTPIGRENASTSFLSFLRSPANTEGVVRLSDSIKGVAGKKRGVKILSQKPVCFSICASPFNCLEVRTPYTAPLSVFEYEIEARYTPCKTVAGVNTPIDLTLDTATLAQYCELNNVEHFNKLVTDYDDKFVKGIDKALVSILLANITNAPVTYPIIGKNQMTGQRVINDELPLWINELVEGAKMDVDDYVIFGGQMVNLVKTKFGITTLSTEGADRVTTALPDMYYNRNFDAIFGQNALVLIPKRVFQFVEWTQFEGTNEFKGEKEIYSTKLLPLGNGTLIPVDWTWGYDPKCGKYAYTVAVFAELVKSIGGHCDDIDEDGIFIIKDCNAAVIPTCV